MDVDGGRFWQELMVRSSGPFALRFILQPVMASIYAIRDARRDARDGRPAYFWALFTDRAHRVQLLRSGWKSIGKVFIAAVVVDLLYQAIVIKSIRPSESLMVAVLLAIVPYLLLRGPVNRLLRHRRHAKPRERTA